ncbi:glycerol-3-phosphate 1-O-acyltransferase PlsY [Mesorhizobium sp. CO1-1-4]|uniref:glycerol-3-phosphate 1-O-acyltransferase PlsY n=1 Tax=Mesorhizobium sp. CO1-1-4 TaxID=2876633 RepID=UPI001CCA4718|nr:glycerol-3-phosphate 1-O-acyltransferase PlsY [Mesorhizobium sp. CO1-1-4]MBZ9740675.1 glycerol-3-phosphate 1-O-acyltransferase PlsY [Mesorhizobium sp. CO1-1-4]
MLWIASAFGLLIAYVLGSTPTGYLLGKFLRNIDIREHGSKSTGATNVLRALGKGPALFVLVVDVLKGVAAILFASWYYAWLVHRSLFTTPPNSDLQSLVPWFVCLSGLAVLVGHGRSMWLKFTGGKSAATGLGVLLAISMPVGIGAAVVWALTLAAFRIVSFSSILAAVTAIVLVLGFEHQLPYRLLVIAGGLYVIVRHRANIQRLIAGAEPRLGHINSEPS